MLLQGPHFENHRSEISTKQNDRVGFYYRDNCVQLPKCAEFHFKAHLKDCHPACVWILPMTGFSLLAEQPSPQLCLWKFTPFELSEYPIYLDISRYLMAAECLNIELYISSVWQSSQNPLDSGLLLRAHLLKFLGVIIIPPTGYELIRNRHRNPTDEDQMVSFISSKYTVRVEPGPWP